MQAELKVWKTGNGGSVGILHRGPCFLGLVGSSGERSGGSKEGGGSGGVYSGCGGPSDKGRADIFGSTVLSADPRIPGERDIPGQSSP